MSKFYEIDSQMRLGARLPSFSQEEIKKEPVLFSATPKFAWQNGGPITQVNVYLNNPMEGW